MSQPRSLSVAPQIVEVGPPHHQLSSHENFQRKEIDTVHHMPRDRVKFNLIWSKDHLMTLLIN